MSYLLVFFLAIILNFWIKKIVINKNIIDSINSRSSHQTLATRSGGTVLFIIISLYFFYLYYNNEQPFDFSILIPLTILFCTGLYDDIHNVDFGLKFIFQIIVAKYLIDIGYVINIFSLFGNEFIFSRQLSQLVTIIFFVSIINAYNFIDGIDSNIHFETLKNLLIILFFLNPNQTLINFIIFIIITVLVTLFFNLSKTSKVFMGDSGSLIIPLLLIIFVFDSNYIGDENIIKYIIIIFLYPLIDLARIVVIRLLNKKSPFIADKNHIHHLINKRLGSHLKSSLLIMLIVFTFQIILIKLFLSA